jgi:hypothetical protein
MSVNSVDDEAFLPFVVSLPGNDRFLDGEVFDRCDLALGVCDCLY